MTDIGWPAVAVMGAEGRGPFVVLCEHASCFFPPSLGHLGLSERAWESHVAWDPGALDVAKRLSHRLDAPLVAGAMSRLVYDCNRPPEAPDCIPDKSEIHDVPGNRGLSAADHHARFVQVHEPFHDAVDAVFAARGGQAVTLVTVHTFTPDYHGARRALEIGYLFHSDGQIAQAAVALEHAAGLHRTALNAPYDASDGVTYSLRKHGDARGLQSVMIEVRNDLVDTPARAEAMADHLVRILVTAIRQADVPRRAAI